MVDLRHFPWVIASSSNLASPLCLPVMHFGVLTLHGSQY